MKWVCKVCGYVYEGPEAPEFCPVCKAPKSKFEKVGGDKTWAAEHVVGVAKDAPEEIKEGLRANFTGECTEVGMYLAWPVWRIVRAIPRSACTGRRPLLKKLSMLPSLPSCWAKS